MARFLLGSILLTACHSGAANPAPGPTLPAPTPPQVVPGACEASALVWADGRFVIGDNETKDLLYTMTDAGDPGAPIPLGAKVDDVEALAADATGVWVVGSQGRKADGELDPERQRLLHVPGGEVRVPDLSACAPCAAAAGLPPENGGINAEGALVADGHLWLGLRSPLVAGKALLVELSLPVNAPPGGATGPVTAVRTLTIDLGGLGIRDLSPAPQGGYYVVAGSSGKRAEPMRLYHLASLTAAPTPVSLALPTDTEGIVVTPDGRLVWVTDGDGKRSPCATAATWGSVSLPAPAGP